MVIEGSSVPEYQKNVKTDCLCWIASMHQLLTLIKSAFPEAAINQYTRPSVQRLQEIEIREYDWVHTPTLCSHDNSNEWIKLEMSLNPYFTF